MQTTAYTVELENFSGPLNVLLQLIQRQKLDICEINLATVTKDYLFFMQNTQLDQHSANSFLEIAVRLILFKSSKQKKGAMNCAQIADKPPTLNFSTKSKKNDVIPA